MAQHDNGEPLSLRRSVVVWVAGAVLGWVIAVITVYGVMRVTGEDKVAEKVDESPAAIAKEAESLQDISPAAGGQDTGRGPADSGLAGESSSEEMLELSDEPAR